jgi:Holliday junction DNA helicase RuvA
VYEFLEGVVVRQAPTTLVLDVGGVGYALSIPFGTRFAEGQRARCWVHLVVREDAHTLYGFEGVDQRDLFRLLLTVRGVGPSVALSLLSGLEAPQLVEAILTENRAALTRAKGVGKRTADQILLDLSERVARFGKEHAFTDAPAPAAADDRKSDAVLALLSIGYKEKEASAIVDKLVAAEPDLDTEQLIRAALRG